MGANPSLLVSEVHHGTTRLIRQRIGPTAVADGHADSCFRHRGERYTGCIGPVSKTVAKEILAKKKAEAVEGRYELPSKKPSQRLDEFVTEYFEYYRTNRRRHSVRRHEIAWRALQPGFAQKRLDDITPFDLERYRRDRKKTGKSDVTINRELAFLRHLYTMAITWGKATGNPVKKVRFAREDNERLRFLTDDEEERLLRQCSPQVKPLVITALHTGFCASELLSLTWDDVNFRRGEITVRVAYAKNGESRSIPMNNVLTATLKVIRMDTSSTGFVFQSRHGTPYRSFRTSFERAVRRAGISDFTFHDLRFTFASRLVMKGADLPTVKELMGHKKIEMTLRYTHLSNDHKRRAVDLLDETAHKVPRIFTTAASQPSSSRL
jgi:integrase